VRGGDPLFVAAGGSKAEAIRIGPPIAVDNGVSLSALVARVANCVFYE
jgi:hypothetical protein